MPQQSKEQSLARFAEAVSKSDRDIDLARAALLIAAEEYPQLDLDLYLKTLERFAGMALARAGPAGGISEMILALNAVLFREIGFRGNSQNYYDPRNSYLNDVLDRRMGIPITLSVVYMETALRMGFNIHGVGMPGHFIVKHSGPGGDTFIDPFNEGRIMDESDCADLLSGMSDGRFELRPEHLAAVSKRQILTRMLTNLQRIYTEGSDYRRALSAVDRILLMNPNSPQHVRDRGLLLAGLGRATPALKDLERYLTFDSSAPDAKLIGEAIKNIRRNHALLS